MREKSGGAEELRENPPLRGNEKKKSTSQRIKVYYEILDEVLRKKTLQQEKAWREGHLNTVL